MNGNTVCPKTTLTSFKDRFVPDKNEKGQDQQVDPHVRHRDRELHIEVRKQVVPVIHRLCEGAEGEEIAYANRDKEHVGLLLVFGLTILHGSSKAG